jgi:stage II sporulation protein D
MASPIERGLGLACLVLALGPASPHPESETRLPRFARQAGEPEPLFRVGFDPETSCEITSSAAFRVVDPASGEDLWRPRHEGPLRVVVDGAPPGGVPSVFRVQVSAVSTAEAAERERERLARTLETEAVVHHDPDRGTYRVRLGRAGDRRELQPLVERARAAGFEDAWIVEEPGSTVGPLALRLVDAVYDSKRIEGQSLAVLPAAGARLLIDGVEVRGVIEIRTTSFGKLRAINWLGLEHYLLGVVPRELGPEIWPELEALKAQAVAARTYAWRNRGQFEHEGFDLCATPRCQVYGGSSAEHPLSDRAVASTRGEILRHDGRPILAYYTATCGGHTEDAAAIFPGESEPYLRGVPCRAEGDALRTLRGEVAGRAQTARADETGSDATRDLALLEVSGVVEPDVPADERVTPERLRTWTSRLAKLAGLAPPAGQPRPAGSLAEAAATIVDDLGWEERGRVLLAADDLGAVLRDPEAEARPERERRALAYLALAQGLRPYPDGTFRLTEPPRAARIGTILARIGETYQAFGLRSSVVSGVGARSVRFVREPGEIRVDTGSDVRLFSLVGGRVVPASRIELWPGDRVRYRTGARGAIDFLELAPPIKGTSDDRTAAVYTWEERRSRREVEAAIGERLAVGQLRGLEVVERGVSGRITRLRVVGSRGTAEVRGFDVRTVLGLRESLVVVEVLRGASGEIETIVFAGKGWGHGVGLCQVGAYGMALRGASYREILAHYYRGAVLGREAVGSS